MVDLGTLPGGDVVAVGREGPSLQVPVVPRQAVRRRRHRVEVRRILDPLPAQVLAHTELERGLGVPEEVVRRADTRIE